MAELKEGLIGGGLNLYFIYKFLRILTTPWEKSEAFKLGIVDDNGKILKKKRALKTSEEKEAYTMMHRLVWKLKRLMEKIPFGKSRLASYAAALWLIKEHKFQGTEEQLQESFLTFLETDWKNDALILKENHEGDMDKKTFSRFKGESTIELNEALKPLDKSVIDAFYYKKEKEGKVVSTDGDSLWKNGMGGQEMAYWKGRKIKITGATDSKSTESILKYMKKSIPSGLLEGNVVVEMWAVGVVYHQEFKNGDRAYFRADVMQKNGRWKGMQVDEFGGKQKKAKNSTANEKLPNWETTPKNEIPKGLKEEVGRVNFTDFLNEHCGVCGEQGIEEKKSATGYELYHKTFSDAMQHAYDHAKSKGFVVDKKEIDDKVATGPKKPSSGKTNRYSLKAGRKTVEIQVANLDNKRYELNMYIEEVELEEGTWAMPDSQKKYDQLMKLMQKKIPAGKAAKILYNFTGDDVLFDAIGKKEKEDKNADVRPMVNHFLELSDVVKYMKKKGIKIEAPFRGSEEVEIDEANLNDFVAKFKQKMGKTTYQTMTDWVDGIGELTKRENKTLKRVLKPFTEEIEIDEKKMSAAAKQKAKMYRRSSAGKKAIKKYLKKSKRPGYRVDKHLSKSMRKSAKKPGMRNSFEPGSEGQDILDEAAVLQITDVDKWTMEIYKGIDAGWKSVAKSTLGGDENVAIMIKLTLEPEKDWPNKILQNARFAMIRIATNGTMEMFASHRNLKNMRKTKIKSAKDVVSKINTWIKSVDEEVEIDEVFNVGKMSDAKLKAFIAGFDADEPMGQQAGMQLKAAKKEAKKRGIKEVFEDGTKEFLDHCLEVTPGEKMGDSPIKKVGEARSGDAEDEFQKAMDKFIKKGGKIKKLRDTKSFKSLFKQKLPKKPPIQAEETEKVEITEGRPAITDPDARRPGDKEKQLRVKAQQKKYKPEEVASIARKHKVKMDGEPIPGNGDWLIAVKGGVTLDYDYRNNETTITGWKVDRKKIRAHINKYEQGGSTYEDLLGSGRKLGIRGFESAFELIGEELQLTEAQKKDAVGRKSIKDRMKDQDKVMGILKGKKKPYKEEAPANNIGSGNVNIDPHLKKKKKKIKTELFGGNKVFIVSGQRFHDSRLGKARYARYEKYVGNDDVGEAIRLYGRTNPKLPIILKNSENGAMLYLKYGNKR